MPQRPARRRPARAKPALNFTAPNLSLVFKSTSDGTGTTSIRLISEVDAPAPWDDPGGTFLEWLKDNSLKLRVMKGATVQELVFTDATVTGTDTVEMGDIGLTPPGVICEIIDEVKGNVPIWCGPLGAWVDTTQPQYALDFP